MSLNPDIGTKVTTKKAEKNTYEKKQLSLFLQNCKKTKMEIFAFSVKTFEQIRI